MVCGGRLSVAGRVGGSGAQATEWMSASSVVCRAGAGLHGSLAVAVTSGVRAGSVSGAETYDGGLVSGAAGANVGATGGGSVSVAGLELGASR